jgi:hypothetical protein
MQALTVTSSVYACLFFVSLYHLLLHFDSLRFGFSL